MVTIRTKTLLLCACFIEAAWLLVAQLLNVTLLLAPCLLCFLALVAWAAIKNMAMPVIFFFLPFAVLLKLRPGTISFFTIALLLIYAIYTVTGSRQVRVLHLVPALLFIVITLIVKTAYGYDFDNSYILFIATLLLIPFLVREMDGGYDFYWLAVCFALGICLAAVTSPYLTVFSNINRYINFDLIWGVVRHAGYTNDPNFYSAHLTTALSGLLILLLYNKQRGRLFVLVPLICIMLYYGLMTVSKSFLLISACVCILWMAALLMQKGKVSIKVTLILTIIIIGIFLLSSTVFTDMLDMIFSRFREDNNLSDLTTGRTEVWSRYIKAIFEDLRLLLFGQGCSDVFLAGEKATHNTLLESVYQLGVIGCILLTIWFVYCVQTFLDGARLRRNKIVCLAVLLIGTFGPWMALDYLFFDEFFLLPIYVCIAVRFLHQQEEDESALLY